LWRDLLTRGINMEYFQEVEPAMTARALLGVMNWAITWYHPDGPLSPEMIADEFADLFLSGLKKRDAE
jgi:hypothetical protein